MTPAGYTIALAAVAAILMAAALVRPKLIGKRLIGIVFGFLGALAVLLLFPRIHPLASVIGAAGVGVRIASWAGRTSQKLTGRLGLLACVAAAAFAVIGASFSLGQTLIERHAIGTLERAPAQAPNVLLIILDTVRGASMSFLGYPRGTTPQLSRLGSDGVIFEQAYATAPWTLPSHAGFFTGRYPSSLSTDWLAPLDDRGATVAEVFRDRGYVTAGFVANYLYTTRESGLARGFVHYEDEHLTLRQALLSTTFLQTSLAWSIMLDPSPRNILRSLLRPDLAMAVYPYRDRRSAERVAADFLQWERSREGRPFFAFINMFDAHGPHAPASWRKRFARNPTRLDRYDGSIAYMDSVVGVIVDSLDARGVLDNAVIVVSSDHGESFGEHGQTRHGNSLYRTELHVPLLVRFKRSVPAAVRVAKPVTLRDLPATLLDIAGLDDSVVLPGVSFRHVWNDPRSAGSEVIFEVTAGLNTGPDDRVSRGPMVSLIDDSTHFIRNGDGVEELYEWRTDPEEKNDLAGMPRFSGRVADIRARLSRTLGKQ